MYYTIIGDIQFTEDENWQEEASIEMVLMTTVSTTLEGAIDVGDMMTSIKMGGFDYVIPQQFNGRIYNNTDHDIVLADGLTMGPKSKMEAKSFYMEGE